MFKRLFISSLFMGIVLVALGALLYYAWFREEKDKISTCYGQG